MPPVKVVYLDHMEFASDLKTLDVECERCGNWTQRHHHPCCAMHDLSMCCSCFRKAHAVEYGVRCHT